MAALDANERLQGHFAAGRQLDERLAAEEAALTRRLRQVREARQLIQRVCAESQQPARAVADQ